MRRKLVNSLIESFQAYANQSDSGIEFWHARDLPHLLGHSKWGKFLSVVSKAKPVYEVAAQEVTDRFVDVGTMFSLRSGTQREIDDLVLTHRARIITSDGLCSLVSSNSLH